MKVMLVKQREGRPTKYNQRVVRKLEDSFKIGATVKEACAVAKITKTTFYDWCQALPEFSVRMEQAQAYSDLYAKKNVNRAIIEDKDLETSKWWLEKRQYNNRETIGIETSDGDHTTRFIITRGEAPQETLNEPIAETPDVATTPTGVEKDGLI